MGKTGADHPYDDYGFEKYEESTFPLAYLLTFTTYGTWLHGDEKGSHDRGAYSPLATRRRSPNAPLKEKMADELSHRPVILTSKQREIVAAAISEVCSFREYFLRALNVRSNHAHAVVSKAVKPEKIVNDFKVYATRRLRDCGEFCPEQTVWTRGASTRYLWKPIHVEAAIDYVLFSQGDNPPGTINLP